MEPKPRPLPQPRYAVGYTLSESARHLRISVRTLHRWIGTGRVPTPARIHNLPYLTAGQLRSLSEFGPSPVGVYPVGRGYSADDPHPDRDLSPSLPFTRTEDDP